MLLSPKVWSHIVPCIETELELRRLYLKRKDQPKWFYFTKSTPNFNCPQLNTRGNQWTRRMILNIFRGGGDAFISLFFKVYMTKFFFICLFKSTRDGDANIEKINSKSLFFHRVFDQKIVILYFRLGPKPRTVGSCIYSAFDVIANLDPAPHCAPWRQNRNALSDVLKNQTNWTGNFNGRLWLGCRKPKNKSCRAWKFKVIWRIEGY